MSNPALKKIFIYEFHTEIHTLVIDIGTEILEFNNLEIQKWHHYQFYEIDLIDKEPTQFTILRINDESMHETLDEYLGPNYWLINHISET